MVNESEMRDGWKLFVHEKNIQVGKGRVLYAEAIHDARVVQPAGWVLPGGRRTQSHEEAMLVAKEIDRMTAAAEVAAARAARRAR